MTKARRITLAMEARVTDRLWDVADIVKLVEAEEAKVIPAKRGPYKPRVVVDLGPHS